MRADTELGSVACDTMKSYFLPVADQLLKSGDSIRMTFDATYAKYRVRAGMTGDKSVLEGVAGEAAKRRLENVLGRQAVCQRLADGFKSEEDRRRLTEIHQRLSAPPFATMATRVAEFYALDKAGRAQLAAESSKRPPSAGRVKIVQRLTAAMGLARLIIDMTDAGFRGTMSLHNEIENSMRRQGMPEQELAEMRSQFATAQAGFAQVSQQVRQVAGDTIASATLLAYRDIPDDDLQAGIAFWESQLGTWYTDKLRTAIATLIETLPGEAARLLP